MPSVSVQLALLAVAKNPASADRTQLEVARDRALTAGHRVLTAEVVEDDDAAINAMLSLWVADDEIDAVIVLGGAEGPATAKALSPLVTELIPGFADLFRWMMFQEKGASAMLASAEAARCTNTFVFVIPGGVAAAMDKLILPQFDPATTPRNLVAEMPRLRKLEAESVPVAVTGERTQGGAGLPARLPAKPAPKVEPARTGANVIARDRTKAATPADPNLRARLPKLPPGANEVGNDDVTKTAVNVAPAASKSDDVTKTGVLVPPPAAFKPPVKPGPTLAPLSNQIALNALAAAADESDDGWDDNATLSDDDEPDANQTMDLDESDLDVAAATPPSAPSPVQRPTTSPPPPPRATATPPVGVVATPAAKDKSGPTKPPPRPTATPAAGIATAAATLAETKRPATTPPPAPRPATDPAEAATTPFIKEEPVAPPQPVKKREPTAPPPVRTSSNELPRGSFKYEKEKKKLHPALWIVGGLAVVALGFFGLIALFPSDEKKSAEPEQVAATPSPTPSPAPADPVPAPVEPTPVEPTPVEPTPAPSEPVPIEMPTKTARTAPTTRPSNSTDQRPVTKPETGPTTKPETGPTTKPDTTPATKPETAPPPEDDCDETSCVMSNYDRPCCARYKPTKTDFAPRVGGVPETLDKAMVRAGIEPIKPRVVKCGETTKVAGTVRVSLSVSADGEVTKASLESSPDPTLGSCVVEAMKRAKFAKSVNGATFTYPFSF